MDFPERLLCCFCASSQENASLRDRDLVCRPLTNFVHGAGADASRHPVILRPVKIEKGRRVTLKVDLSVSGGQQLEKNTVEYVQGAGTMLSGLEKVLEGLEPGAKREGTLKPEDAFGNPAVHPTKTMKRSEFPKDAKLNVGEKLVAASDDKAKMNVIIKIEKITGDNVEVRLVHPLAEKSIAYKVEVIQVTDPRPPPMPAKALKLEEDS
jgi:FKBP-type peptidyl-prolyl cis-trans isomerase SlyD